MKKYIAILGALGLGSMLNAQVSIHKETPQATLDVRESSLFSASDPQGVSFPNFTTEERATFVGVQKGTMIYNITKHCIEVYTEKNNTLGWYCICDTCEFPIDENVILDSVDIPSMMRYATIWEYFIKNYRNNEGWNHEFCNSQTIAEITNNEPVIVNYTSSKRGRIPEKRYTKDITTYSYKGELLDRNKVTLVIPSVDIYKGNNTFNAYIEIDGDGVLRTSIKDAPIYWDIEIGGHQKRVTIEIREGMFQCIE